MLPLTHLWLSLPLGASLLPSVADSQTIMLRYNHLTPKAISKSLLLDTALHRMQLEGNGSSFTQKRLQRLEGFEEFEARRVKRLNREIAGGLVVDRSLCGISD